MSLICNDCNSHLIGWRAIIDQDYNIIDAKHDEGQCMDCGSQNLSEERDV